MNPCTGLGVSIAQATAQGYQLSDLTSLLVIVTLAAVVPLVVGWLHIHIAEAVMLLAGGVVVGPEVLGWVQIDDAISLMAQLGLGFLFFHAGLELDQRAISGRSGRLAVIGWGASLLVAGVTTAILQWTGFVRDFLGVAIALTTTSLGTLLPILTDRGDRDTRFGKYFIGAATVGELGPVIAVAILLGTRQKYMAIASLAALALIGYLLAAVPARVGVDRLLAMLDRGNRTTSQTGIRVIVVLMVGLLTLAGSFGLDTVLGAFAAGMIVRRYLPPAEDSQVSSKIEAIAFGFFIPVFFVVSGALLDVRSILENPSRLLVFFVLILIARGLPQLVVYREVFPDLRERFRFSVLLSTGLPIIVAITTVGVATGVMLPENAAALVGAGAMSVLVFPLLAERLAPVTTSG